MDYFEEGKKNQKDFSKFDASVSHAFEKYVFDFVLKDKHENDAEKYVSGLLYKTKNESLYLRAVQIARRIKKNQVIWGRILYQFNILNKGNTKMKWGFSFVSTIINDITFKLNNYDIGKLVTMIYTYDGAYSGWWFTKIVEKDWFLEYNDYIKTSILKFIDKFDRVAWERNISILDCFKDMYFYMELIEKTPSARFFESIITSIYKYKRGIYGFLGGFTLDDLIIKYPHKFSESMTSMTFLTNLIREFHTPNTGELFVDLLTKTGFTEENNTMWLFKLSEINSNAINLKLYNLTGDEKYLPQSAKDVFLF